jgi:hypothetical protein
MAVEAYTYCDFGTPGRADRIAKHFTIGAARRCYARIKKIYSGPQRGNEVWRLWQVATDGSVINDSNGIEAPDGAQLSPRS